MQSTCNAFIEARDVRPWPYGQYFWLGLEQRGVGLAAQGHGLELET